MAASRRPAAAIVVVVVLAALVGGWWWRHTANERHINGLLDMAYEYAGLPDGPPHKFNYFRNDFGEGGCPVSDGQNWTGHRAANSRIDNDVDWQAGAERAAVRFEQEGWNVRRYIDSTVVAGTPEIVAWKDVDHIRMSFAGNYVDLSAVSGPCNRNRPPEPPKGARVVEVDHFDR
jgi:hypothetical protein